MHAILTFALACDSLTLYGFSGEGTIDAHEMSGVHNIELEHALLQRLIDFSLPASAFPSEQTRVAWAATKVQHAG